jgi:8-oxo-dGTP pyrophosphatase MutT (NUDIX family)
MPAASGTAAPLCRSAFSARAARSWAVSALRNARATSAGGVVHRTSDGQVQIALVHRRQPHLWALPKGTPDAGETLEETALRETREETGLRVVLEAPIQAISYVFVHGRTRYHKTVHFFRMRAIGGSVDDHDHEFDEVAWVPLEEARELLTYETDRAVVEAALRQLEDGQTADIGQAAHP